MTGFIVRYSGRGADVMPTETVAAEDTPSGAGRTFQQARTFEEHALASMSPPVEMEPPWQARKARLTRLTQSRAAEPAPRRTVLSERYNNKKRILTGPLVEKLSRRNQLSDEEKAVLGGILAPPTMVQGRRRRRTPVSITRTQDAFAGRFRSPIRRPHGRRASNHRAECSPRFR